MNFFDDFVIKYNGKGIDWDGYYGFQCMDLAEQYNQDVVGAPKLGGNAIDVWTGYSTSFYDKSANTPAGVPQKGDIVIWGEKVGKFGHIAVFSSGDANNFTSFDQNWPIQLDANGNGIGVCHLQAHDYNGVLGWLRPKKQESMVTITQKELDDLRNARDKNYNDYQAEILKYNNTQSLLNTAKNDLIAKDNELASISSQLTNCLNKPPQIIEKPVEKLVYVEKIIYSKDLQKMSFWDKLKFLIRV